MSSWSITGRSLIHFKSVVVLFEQTYTLGYRVFDGAVIDTTFIFLTVTRSSAYKPPVFDQTVYISNGVYVEKDSDAVGKVIGVVCVLTKYFISVQM